MSTSVARDDWGFSDADHAALQALMTRHRDRVQDVMIEVMTRAPAVSPNDLGAAVGTMVVTDTGQMRGFPPGGFWRALLEGLRALEDE